MVYRRLSTDTASRTLSSPSWRQIYKSLQLIEYLLRNGSERVIDNVRDHLYQLKSLQSFHHVDDKGKDQGLNVRHRAKEIVDLIQDVDRLRDERRKAEENRRKYTGVAAEQFRSGGSFMGSSAGATRKYEGFSSSDYNNNYSSSNYPAADSTYTDERRHSGGGDNTTAIPVPKMAHSPDHKAHSTTATSTTTAHGTTTTTTSTTVSSNTNTANLLDLDFGTSVSLAVNKQDEWGEFTSATNTSSSVPAHVQSQATVKSSVSKQLQVQSDDEFTEFQGAHTTTGTSASGGFANFGAAGFATGSGGAGFTSGGSAGFASFPAPTLLKPTPTPSSPPHPQNYITSSSHTQNQPSHPQQPQPPPQQPWTTSSNLSDLLGSNLVSLDSLGKPPGPTTGPALNELKSTTTTTTGHAVVGALGGGGVYPSNGLAMHPPHMGMSRMGPRPGVTRMVQPMGSMGGHPVAGTVQSTQPSTQQATSKSGSGAQNQFQDLLF